MMDRVFYNYYEYIEIILNQIMFNGTLERNGLYYHKNINFKAMKIIVIILFALHSNNMINTCNASTYTHVVKHSYFVWIDSDCQPW